VCFIVRSVHRVVEANFLYSLTSTASSPSPLTTPQSLLMPELQSQSSSATTEVQTEAMAVVEMQMTQSSPYIRLGYCGISICACISLSATCTVLYKQIFYSLMQSPQSPLMPALQSQLPSQILIILKLLTRYIKRRQ